MLSPYTHFYFKMAADLTGSELQTAQTESKLLCGHLNRKTSVFLSRMQPCEGTVCCLCTRVRVCVWGGGPVLPKCPSFPTAFLLQTWTLAPGVYWTFLFCDLFPFHCLFFRRRFIFFSARAALKCCRIQSGPHKTQQILDCYHFFTFTTRRTGGTKEGASDLNLHILMFKNISRMTEVIQYLQLFQAITALSGPKNLQEKKQYSSFSLHYLVKFRWFFSP